MMQILRTARTLDLPDWWIGAGFVRNKVWDVLHEYTKPTPLKDIDVVYFDPHTLDESREKEHDAALRKLHPNVIWSTKNQARMHLHPTHLGEAPYRDSRDALARWIETATCIAIRLNDQDELIIAAPYGLDDLFSLIVRPIPLYRDLTVFHQRYSSKGWLKTWPRLTVVAHR